MVAPATGDGKRASAEEEEDGRKGREGAGDLPAPVDFLPRQAAASCWAVARWHARRAAAAECARRGMGGKS